ncbi:MAG: hypothetical protein FWC90_08135, partial [Oscillospiraceae bacterium]|nr:hypothetical protein [Oscillospiraceae bacterium]
MKRRKFFSLLFSLLSVALCANIALSAFPLTYAGSADRWDLANFVDHIVLSDESGNVIPSGSDVIIYENYEFAITFREIASFQFGYGTDGLLRYVLPSELHVSSAELNIPILAENGATIGHYSVTTDGLVTVRFDDCNKNGIATPGVNLLDQYTDISFTIFLSAQFTDLDDLLYVDFGNNHTVTISVKPPDYDTKLDVVKKHFGYNKSARTIDYEILVTALGGDISQISLRDALGGTHHVPSDLASASLTQITVQVRDKEPYVISPIPWESSGNSFVIDFPEIVLARGETITLTYTLDADPYIQSWGEVSSGRRNYDFSISNSVSASGKDSSGNDLTDNHAIWLPVTNYFLNKWATQAGDGTITWNCHIGDGLTLLNGVTVTDTLSAGMTTADSVIYAYLYDQSGNYIAREPITINTDHTGFTYTVPDGLNGRDIYTVSLTYSVEIDFATYPADGRYT